MYVTDTLLSGMIQLIQFGGLFCLYNSSSDATWRTPPKPGMYQPVDGRTAENTIVSIKG